MVKKSGRIVPSWAAYIASLAALFVGFIFAAFKTSAPFEPFSWGVVGLATSYFAKRVIDKKYQGAKSNNGAIDPEKGGLG